MKILHLMHIVFGRAYYAWALREIDPLHPDVPAIVIRQSVLNDKARHLFT